MATATESTNVQMYKIIEWLKDCESNTVSWRELEALFKEHKKLREYIENEKCLCYMGGATCDRCEVLVEELYIR